MEEQLRKLALLATSRKEEFCFLSSAPKDQRQKFPKGQRQKGKALQEKAIVRERKIEILPKKKKKQMAIVEERLRN